MPDRVNVDLNKLRLAKGDMSDAEFKRRSRSSRQTTDDLNDRNMATKAMLPSAFLKAHAGVRGIDDSLISEIKNCRSFSEAGDLAQLVELRTNGALLTLDGGASIALSDKREFGHIFVNQASGRQIMRPFLATYWPVQDIIAHRRKVEEAVHGLNLFTMSQPSDEDSAERDFMLKNLELLAPQSIWCADNPEVVTKNAESLQILRKGLNTWSSEPDVSEHTSDDLDSLIKRSQDKVQLNTLFNDKEFFKDYQFCYAPMVVNGRIDLELRERDWGPVQGEYQEETRNLHFDLPVRRVIHCFVIAEAQREALIVQAPRNYVLSVSASRDLAWDQEYFRVGKPSSGHVLRDVDELLTAIAERKRSNM